MTKNNKKEKNWTLIACTAFSAALLIFIGISTRITKITENYRNELLVSYANQNDKLRVNDCERPIAIAVGNATLRGKPTRVDDQIVFLDETEKAKCMAARQTIEKNEEKMRALTLVPAPFSYMTKHFFG
jgi:transcription initiation factor TFIID subunit TAF12